MAEQRECCELSSQCLMRLGEREHSLRTTNSSDTRGPGRWSCETPPGPCRRPRRRRREPRAYATRRSSGDQPDLCAPSARGSRGNASQSALVDHPSVAEAAVVGAKDDTTGQAIIVFVTLKADAAAGHGRRRSLPSGSGPTSSGLLRSVSRWRRWRQGCSRSSRRRRPPRSTTRHECRRSPACARCSTPMP